MGLELSRNHELELNQEQLDKCQEYAMRRRQQNQYSSFICTCLANGSTYQEVSGSTHVIVKGAVNDTKSFDMEIRTKMFRSEDGMDQFVHKMYNVSNREPHLNIRAGDEIVLFGDKFVPDLSHETLIDLIGGIKVCGETWTDLVLSRPEKRFYTRHHGDRQWIKTRAFVCPTENKYIEEMCKRCSNGCYAYKTEDGLKYLEVKDGEITADVITCEEQDDKLKAFKTCTYICKEKDGKRIPYASLQHVETGQYIAIQDEQVCLQETEYEFRLGEEKNCIIFWKAGEKDLFLAYDAQHNKLTVATKQYLFHYISYDDLKKGCPMKCSGQCSRQEKKFTNPKEKNIETIDFNSEKRLDKSTSRDY